MKFICDQCKAKYQIADDKIAGKTVRMKCRKCGHQIEVRAEVTESSVASRAPSPDAMNASPAAPGVARPAGPAGAPPRPGVTKPAAPRVGPLATSLAAAKPAPPRAANLPPKPGAGGEKSGGGALAGAFKSSVGREEEISASFDLAELSAADEWYAAINGVPVGPIRIAEVRRKAALGAVTEDSLVWQEGLEEWRPVRAFAELAAIVREAATGGRTSLLTPAPPDAKVSRPAPARTSAPPRANAPGAPLGPSFGSSPTPAPRAPYAAPGAAAIAARSNVVPITSRLATAERLDDATMAMPDEPRDSRVAADPFASGSSAAGAAAMSASLGSPMPSPSFADVPPPVLAATATAVDAREASTKKAPPWIAIAMVVLAAAFGITAALALFLRQPAAPPAPVVIQMPSGLAQQQPAPTAGPQANALPENDPSSPLPQTSGTAGPRTGPGPIAAATGAKPPPTASTGGFSLSGGLGVNRPTVDPNATGGSEGPKPPGQCLTQGQIQGVIGQHRIGVSRMCWDKSPSTRQSVNVTVTLAIGPGGEVQTVQAGGEDNSVSNCVANDVRNWRFPAGGCVQQTMFSLKFVKQ